ncbi:MAG: alpha/beta hydrolase [Pseudomonadota bacterium]
MNVPPFSMARRTGILAAATAFISGCSGVQVLDKLVPSNDYSAETGLAYGPDPRQRLDVYRPTGTPGATRPPVVVFFYGGAWSHGNRADYRFVGEALASRGAIVVVADYRLSPQVRYPVFVQDSALAVRWAADHAESLGSDAQHLVLMGHSAGAYNAAMLALDPRWLGVVGMAPGQLMAWIGLAGPYDFLPIGDPETQVAFQWPDTPPDSQPMAHASAKAPRTLLMVSEQDKVVDPQRNTLALARKLQLLGVPVTLHQYPRVSHVTLIGSVATPLRFLAPVRDDLLAFLGLEKKS